MQLLRINQLSRVIVVKVRCISMQKVIHYRLEPVCTQTEDPITRSALIR